MFVGAPAHQKVQKYLYDLRAQIAEDPHLSNGGRVLNILDFEAVGLDRLRAYLDDMGFVSLTDVPLDETCAMLRAAFEDDIDLIDWDVFMGDAETVVPAAERVLAGRSLPDGWSLTSHSQLDADIMAEMTTKSSAAGVAPAPAYFVNGELFPSTTSILRAPDGTIAGCANATYRYHPQSRLAGSVFAGGIAVDATYRGQGFGKLLNAAVLRDSHADCGWQRVIEQAKSTNAASCAMIQACGLHHTPRQSTIALSRVGSITR